MGGAGTAVEVDTAGRGGKLGACACEEDAS